MALELKPQGPARQPVPGLNELVNRFRPRRRVTARDRMFFTEQLALLLEAGLALHSSLQTLRAQAENPAMGQVVAALLTDVAEGKTFSHALSRHPEVFSQTYVNLIAASENGGFMHQVLAQLLEMDEKREALHRTMVSALSYPAFLLVFALAVVIFVLVVVFPKFGATFSSIRDQLPGTTLVLMATSDLLRHYWAALIPGLIVGVALVRYWMVSDAGARRLDYLKLSLPGLSNIFVKLYLVRFLRVVSLSLGNGVGIMDTLKASREVVSNRLFQSVINDVALRVQEGSGIAPGLNRQHFIPKIVGQLIQTGEETGNLPKVTGRLASYYEQELEKYMKTLSRLAEPVMLLVMGAVVGLLVSSLILPIFKLSRAVH